ncbi:MAG: hypothetical protein RLZ12_128 [Bacillota bacterium]
MLARRLLDETALLDLLSWAGKDYSNLNLESLKFNLAKQTRSNMAQDEALALAMKLTVEKTSAKEPEWQFVAAKLLAYSLYQETAALRTNTSQNNYSNFYELVSTLTELGIYGAFLLKKYTVKEITWLGKKIVPERDYLFNYIGLQVLSKRYLARDTAGHLFELPQERFMIIAMHLAQDEQEKLFWAEKFYEVLSKLEITVATPTLANAGKRIHQLSSCFIDTVDDSLSSIYNTNTSCANVSKYGGGVGIYLGKVRARGSKIRGKKGASSGVIPWIRNYNNTAVAVDQLGVRRGAFAIYLDIWHADILDFLNLKTNNGDDRLKAHDIFPGISVPDLFMKCVQERKNWLLFDPYEIREKMGFSLEDSYGSEFETRYKTCAENAELNRIELPALDIMKKIMISAFETGTPFIFFRDAVNKFNPNKHLGMIYSSNLCVEICQNMSPTKLLSEEVGDDNIVTTKHQAGDFVVCNLSSLNLGKVQNFKDLERIIPIQMRMLDNVIDLTMYPVPQARITNKKYRALGLGTSGYHQYLATHGIPWESEEHLEQADQLFEEIAYQAVKTSVKLAREKGSCPAFIGSEWQTGVFFKRRNYTSPRWQALQKEVAKHGMRNSYLLAIAPTGSTSLIAGSTASIDPVYAKYFVEEKRGMMVPQTAPELNAKTTWYYKEAHTIDQLWSIKAAAKRQRHIDQSQSFNLYITPETDAAKFLALYLEAWKAGLKTIYYVRNRSLEAEECISCSS